MRLIKPTVVLAALVALAACNSTLPTSPSALGGSQTSSAIDGSQSSSARVAADADSQAGSLAPSITADKEGKGKRPRGPGDSDRGPAAGGGGKGDQGKHDDGEDNGDDNDDDHDDDKGGTGVKIVSARLAANPTSIQVGQSSTLTWSSANATSAKLNGVVVATSGSRVVSPTQTTTYTFVATGVSGTATATAMVTVGTVTAPGMPSATLTANPLSIQSGQQSVLTWSTTGATSATLDGAAVALNGTQMVSPTATTVYTLLATGSGGNATATATVTVSTTPTPPPPPAPGLTFTADIEPILSYGCVVCHSATVAFAGVNLSTFDGVMAVVTPGSANSKLVKATAATGSMYNYLIPTASHTKVEQSDLIRQWVLTGAVQ